MLKFELTRGESTELENLLSLARMQEGLLNCVTDSYKSYIIGVIFPRVGLKAKDFPKAIINLSTGELSIREEEALPKNPVKVEAKGEKNGHRGSEPTKKA